MNETAQNVTQVARDISDYGIMIIICAVFLILSSGLMIACFRWFKSIIGNILNDYSDQMVKLQETATKNESRIVEIVESLAPATLARTKTIANLIFDLSTERVCRIIKKIREENNIADREATKAKINALLTNCFEERNSKLDNFLYKGKKLSYYTDREWIEWVAKVVEGELYNENGVNNGRAYTNVQAVYDRIEFNFYHRLTNQ